MRVGLVGAGPWAQFVHAPMLAAEPQVEFVGIWARRPEAAAELAAANVTVAVASTAELFEQCEAVAFAVPPSVQAELAIEAARAGCHLLLEKPIGGSVAEAEALVDAVATAGVVSQVVLTWRYAPVVHDFLADAAEIEPIGGAGRFLSGALLGGPFATPWRLERGALVDLGPHVIDLLDAAIGPVVGVRAAGDLGSWITLQLEHESGVISTATMSATVGNDVFRAGAELYSSEGVVEVDCSGAFPAMDTITGEFVEAVAQGGHPLDAARGLHLQRIIADAEAQLL
ncbi:MAG: Gfo/Idh/MocA family oxidoreductase [Acidimicrobiales bacterium]|nr:Gfo/Idh/MocA family oxidoreductase [Acidimicrobiales bacterium]